MTDTIGPELIEKALAALLDKGMAEPESVDYYIGSSDQNAHEVIETVLSAVAPLIAAQALEVLRDYLAEDRRVWHGDCGVRVATDTSDPRTMIPLDVFLSASAAKLREADYG